MKTAEKYTLTPEMGESLSLQFFLALQEDASLEIEVSSDDNGEPRNIQGRIDAGWRIAGPAKWIKPIDLAVQVDNSQTEFNEKITDLNGEIVIGKAQLKLSGILDTFIDLHFSADEVFSKETALTILSDIGVETNGGIMNFFQRFSPNDSQYALSLGVSEGMDGLRSVYRVSTAIEDQDVPGFNLTLVKPTLDYEVMIEEGNIPVTDENCSFSGLIQRTDKKEFEYELEGSFTVGRDDSLMFSIGADLWQQVSFFDLLIWLSLLEESDVKKAKQSPFSLFDHILFQHLMGQINTKTKQLDSFEFAAGILIDEVEFDLTYSIPFNVISCRLNPDTPIRLDKVLNKGFNSQHLFPADCSLNILSLNYGLKDHDFSLELGIHDAWNFQFGATSVKLTELFFSLSKDEAGFAGSVLAQMKIGEIELSLLAETERNQEGFGWHFETQFIHNVSIPLKTLIQDLAQIIHFPSPDHVPDVEISNLMLSYHTHTRNFHLEVGTSIDGGVIGPFEKAQFLAVIDLAKNDEGTHNFRMDVSGLIEISKTQFTFEAADLGRKDWSLDLTWDKGETEGLDLTKIMQFFAGESFQPHKDYSKIKNHLLIEHAEFHYQHGVLESKGQEAIDTTFLMDLKVSVGKTTVEGLFSGIKPSGDGTHWDFLVGIGYEHHANIPSEMFQNEHLSKFNLDNLWILVNTADEPGKKWPPLPKSIPPILTQQTNKAGIAMVAKMDMSKQDNKLIPGGQKAFARTKNTELFILAQLTNTGLLIEAEIEGNLVIPTGKGKDIEIEEVSLTLTIGEETSLKLSGKFELELDDHDQHLTISLDVDEFGIVIIADDEIDNKVNTKGWEPFGLKGMNIDELGFELGVDFEPPGARIGFEGKMHVDGGQVGADQLAIVMEFVGPVPNPEYLAIAFDQIKFQDILNLFPGSSSEGHSHISDNLFEIDNFGLVWCEKPVILPDGTNGRLGFSLHGGVKILNWGAYFSLEVHPETGIQGFGELAPLHLGPLVIQGKGTGVSIKQEEVGGKWRNVSNVTINPSPKKNAALRQNPLPTRMHEIVAPGGVMIQFNSAASPYLRMSADVTLFGMDLLDIDIDIEDDSALFDLFIQIPAIAKFKVHCVLKKNHDFMLQGSFFLGLSLKFDIPFFFGPIHVNIQLGLEAGLEVSKTKDKINLKLTGGFAVMGMHYELANIIIKGIPDSLKELPNWILQYLKEGHVPDFTNKIHEGSGANNRDEYSKQRYLAATELLVKAKQWAEFVRSDIESLKKERGLTATEIAALVRKMNEDIENINKEGERQVKAIEANTDLEKTHLQHLIDSTQKEVGDANETRAQEMITMQHELEWLEDKNYELREAIRGLMSEFSEEAETVLSSKLTQYPKRAVDHHYRIMRIHAASHKEEQEILERGRKHAHAILTMMNRERFTPLERIKPEGDEI